QRRELHPRRARDHAGEAPGLLHRRAHRRGVRHPLRPRTVTALLAAGGFAGGMLAVAVWIWPPQPPRSSAELMDILMWEREPVGGPCSLVDREGRPRSDTDFRSKLLRIYFGFAYCADVCPTALQSIAGALDQLGPAGERVQPLFITVDPEKDTPEQLKQYVALFHPRLVGLTGRARQICKVADTFKVYHAKSEPTRRDSREIDHTGFTYLLDARGRYLGFFPPGTQPERLVAAMQPHLGTLAGAPAEQTQR